MRSGRIAASYKLNGVEYRCDHTFINADMAKKWLLDERKDIELGIWVPPDQRADAQPRATAGPAPLLTEIENPAPKGTGWYVTTIAGRSYVTNLAGDVPSRTQWQEVGEL